MTAAAQIRRLFWHEDRVMRPSEIERALGLPKETVRKALYRMVQKREIFNICHAQYAISEKARPLLQSKVSLKFFEDRISALESRVEELERKTGTLL